MTEEVSTTHCDGVNRAQAAVTDGQKYLDGLPQTPKGYNNPIEKVEKPFDLNSLRYRQPVYVKEQNKRINLVPSAVEDFVSKINDRFC